MVPNTRVVTVTREVWWKQLITVCDTLCFFFAIIIFYLTGVKVPTPSRTRLLKDYVKTESVLNLKDGNVILYM